MAEEIDSNLITRLKPEKLHKEARDYLLFQIYLSSEFIYDNYGLEELKKFYHFNQESFFRLKMSRFLKDAGGIIKKLPKRLKLKEVLKLLIDQMQSIENPKNIRILELTKDRATFEITKCTFRKVF